MNNPNAVILEDYNFDRRSSPTTLRTSFVSYLILLHQNLYVVDEILTKNSRRTKLAVRSHNKYNSKREQDHKLSMAMTSQKYYYKFNQPI